jgi:opacity protein-like surface antigen
MKRLTLIATLAATLMGAGLVAAQAPSSKATDPHAGHHPETAGPGAAGKGKAPKDEPGMGGGKMGMMGMGGGMMGMCPGMMGAGAKMEVVKLPKGVTITLTSDDPKVVARVQKMAEGMRLMHEASAE